MKACLVAASVELPDMFSSDFGLEDIVSPLNFR